MAGRGRIHPVRAFGRAHDLLLSAVDRQASTRNVRAQSAVGLRRRSRRTRRRPASTPGSHAASGGRRGPPSRRRRGARTAGSAVSGSRTRRRWVRGPADRVLELAQLLLIVGDPAGHRRGRRARDTGAGEPGSR
ncbi:hypothetical protein BN2537_1019 [Streptomyces venezuelae]|nr:hypothetical protein BN2537_1019 [Streptomyces venezuelae]